MHKRLQISAWTNSQFFYKLKIKVQLFSFNLKKKKKSSIINLHFQTTFQLLQTCVWLDS